MCLLPNWPHQIGESGKYPHGKDAKYGLGRLIGQAGGGGNYRFGRLIDLARPSRWRYQAWVPSSLRRRWGHEMPSISPARVNSREH